MEEEEEEVHSKVDMDSVEGDNWTVVIDTLNVEMK